MKINLLVSTLIFYLVVLNAQDDVGSATAKIYNESYEKGVEYFNREKLEQAEMFFQKVLKNNPDDIKTLKFLAEIAIAQQNFPDVEHYFGKVLKLEPDDQDALINLGVIKLNEGNLVQAEKLLLNAVENEPNNELALFNLGVLYGADGNFSSATELLNKVISINPNKSKYYETLGMYFLLQDNYSDAEAMFLKALTIDKKLLESRKGLVIIYQIQNKLTRSQEYINDLEAISPELPSLNLLKAQQHYLKKEIFLAIDFAKQAIEENPLQPDAYYLLGDLYKIKGEEIKADNFLNIAEKLNANSTSKQFSSYKK